MLELPGRQRALLVALYPILIVLVLNQLADVLVSIMPMRTDEVTWRYGAQGFLVSSMPTVAIGTALTLALAALQDHRVFARWIGVWAVAFAVIVGVAVISFGLDALQVRRLIPENAKSQFDDQSFKSLVIAVLFVPAMIWTGWSAIRFAKGAGAKDDGPTPLVVGN
jgi:hypothetical protein